MDDFFDNDYESYDSYDATPFGDAMRFEDNCLASEYEYDYPDEDSDFDSNFEEVSEAQAYGE